MEKYEVILEETAKTKIAEIYTYLREEVWPPSYAGEWLESTHDAVTLLSSNMTEYLFTDYFEQEVLRKRPYIRREWCIQVVEQPLRVERQEDNRWRFWASIPDLEGRFLRVITLEDRRTIHNAFPDRDFTP